MARGITHDRDRHGNVRVYYRKRGLPKVRLHEPEGTEAFERELAAARLGLRADGKRGRGKRTLAKEKVFKEISRQIRTIRPNFNIGTSTGTVDLVERWTMPYAHWKFVPREHEIDRSAGKRKAPPGPT